MRKGYKIGLFFICVMIAALVAALLCRRYLQGRVSSDEAQYSEGGQTRQLAEQDAAVQEDEADVEEAQEVPAQSVNIVTTCDTVCIYENIDKKDGAVSTEEAKLPAKYIGLTREQLEQALLDDSQASTLEDKEKGFQSQHLELFSAEKIKILRIYDTSTELTGYYILELDGEIGVYLPDRTTLYFKTGLDPEALPEDVRSEVQEGKYMESELQVYHFLESYSS